MIKAECHSDDGCIEVAFDATQWFDRASKKEIKSLARCGWGGDYPSDAVAHYMANLNPLVAEMFTYLGMRAKMETIGFECHVNKEDAMIWLKAKHPGLWKKISQEEE